ncbi:pancreatic secretory granule membrane major glycoprotein GP2-like isoform X2 [Pleurodeles waltl]|uniref:pancreatic secretory granule membrane major glycoprotein GP2-like isoform X2 n=1 Tax=Pleurodeles waltl TaxID=8319 RepID=UPI003709BDCB
MARLKMKTWMGFLFALSFLQTGYCQCTGCASDEICNTDTSTCDCDLNLYTRSVLPTPSLECSSGNISLTISRCQLERNHYDSSGLHLRDRMCGGARNIINTTAKVIVSSEVRASSCGNQVMVNGSHMIFSNVLTIPGRVRVGGIITRNNVTFSFSCAYHITTLAALRTPLHVATHPKEVSVPDVAGDLEPEMKLYKDKEYAIPFGISETFPVDETLNITII